MKCLLPSPCFSSVSFSFWSGSLVDCIYMGLVFLSIQLPYLSIAAVQPLTFKVIIHRYVLFFQLHWPFIPSWQVLYWWFGGNALLLLFLVSEALYFSINFKRQPCWVKNSWLKILAFHYFEYFVPIPTGLVCFCREISWQLCIWSIACLHFT